MFLIRLILAFLISTSIVCEMIGQETLDKEQLKPSQLEIAQDAAFQWLFAQQLPDGGWECDRIIDPITKKEIPRLGRNGATALALIALNNHGYSYTSEVKHDRLGYQEKYKKGVAYLLKSAKKEGVAGYSWTDPEGGNLSHAFAVEAICRDYNMTKANSLQEYAQGGLDVIGAAIEKNRLGEGVMPGNGTDIETTVWQTSASYYGALSYLTIKPATLKTVRSVLDNTMPPVADYSKTTVAGLAQAVHAGILLGLQYDHDGIQKAIPILSKYKPCVEEPATNFYVGRVLHKLDMDTRKSWLEIVPPVILAGQIKGTPLPDKKLIVNLPGQQERDDITGSWPPGKFSKNVRLGHNRLEATCLNILAIGYTNSHWNKRNSVLKSDKKTDESFPL